jgi:hypothetical protein
MSIGNEASRECALRLIEDHESMRKLVVEIFEAIATHRLNSHTTSPPDIALWDSSQRLMPEFIADSRIRKILSQPIPTNSSQG